MRNKEGDEQVHKCEYGKSDETCDSPEFGRRPSYAKMHWSRLDIGLIAHPRSDGGGCARSRAKGKEKAPIEREPAHAACRVDTKEAKVDEGTDEGQRGG